MRLALACALLVGCSSTSGGAGAGPVDGAATDGSLDAADASSLDATTEGGGADGGDAGGLVISNVTITPNPSSVLSATLTFTTNLPATGSAQVVNTAAPANTIAVPAEPSATTTHTLWLLGMRAQSSFAVTVSAGDGAGHAATATATYATGALPADMPPLTVVTNDKTQTAPGFLLLNVQEFTGAPVAYPGGPAGAYVIGLDADLEIVWYLHAQVTDPERLPNGHLVALNNIDSGWAEYDMMGHVVQDHPASALGVDTLTHAITPEATGSLLSISTELRFVPGYPAPDGGTQTLPVVGTNLVELPGDGGRAAVVADGFDLFDPLTQIGNPGLFDVGEWNYLYPDAGATRDWLHDNAVVTDPSDDTLVASSRNLSWIFKVDRQGHLKWRLGYGGDFTLSDAGVGAGFFSTQHGAYVTAAGTIMCFDDGFVAPTGPPYTSRAIELALDTAAMKATMVWQYADDFYSQIFGSSYVLSNGNVLVDDGCELATRSGLVLDPNNLKYARVMEVTHAMPPVKVAEVDIQVPLGSFAPDPGYSGFGVYRAQKIASLY